MKIIDAWVKFRDKPTLDHEWFRCSCGSLLRDDEPLESHTSCPREFHGGVANQIYARRISLWEWIKVITGIHNKKVERAKRALLSSK